MLNQLLLEHRHSEEMVKKLESAGLGFFLREDENIPMLGVYI